MTFQELVSRANVNSFLMDDKSTQHPKPKRKRSKRSERALKLFMELAPEQQLIAFELVTAQRSLIKCGKKQYAAKRTSYGWSLAALDGSAERVINCDLTECSCEDSRFRGRQCKHMTALKALTAGP